MGAATLGGHGEQPLAGDTFLKCGKIPMHL